MASPGHVSLTPARKPYTSESVFRYPNSFPKADRVIVSMVKKDVSSANSTRCVSLVVDMYLRRSRLNSSRILHHILELVRFDIIITSGISK